MNTSIDLSFYLEPPDLKISGELEITALAPLSMVSSQPGAYFRTESAPTDDMLYGLLENVLGWHFDEKLRRELAKSLAKQAKKRHRKSAQFKDHPWLTGKLEESGSGYRGLLQFHVAFESVTTPPIEIAYDDLWSMHLRDKGMNFVGGSRQYDAELEDLITLLRSTKKLDKDLRVEFGDRTGFKRIDYDVVKSTDQKKIHVDSLRPGFPMHYVSPKQRGYVLPAHSYRYSVSTIPALSALFDKFLIDPVAVPYLGSNDGWVHLKWQRHV